MEDNKKEKPKLDFLKRKCVYYNVIKKLRKDASSLQNFQICAFATVFLFRHTSFYVEDYVASLGIRQVLLLLLYMLTLKKNMGFSYNICRSFYNGNAECLVGLFYFIYYYYYKEYIYYMAVDILVNSYFTNLFIPYFVHKTTPTCANILIYTLFIHLYFIYF